MFPALGFGAQLPPDWKVSEARLFPLGQDGICVYVSPGSALESSGAGVPAPLLSLHLPQTHTYFSA